MTFERSSAPHTPAAPDWVVLANATRARVFERDEGSGAMREILDAVHPAGREKDSALGRDRPGRARKGAMSTAFPPRTAPQAREREHFAQELSRMLESAAVDHRMPGLVVLASNPFLGELKARLGPNARALLKASIASDFTTFEGADLEHRVRLAWAERAAGPEPP